MPTYDGIGSSVTHEIEVVGDVFISNVEGGSLSTQVPFEIFSNVSGMGSPPTDSRQVRLRVQPTVEASPDDSYVTDMGIQNTTDNYFFITAPQNTSNVGDQNTFVISTTSNVGIGTTNPTSTLHLVGDELITGTLTASNIVGGSPLTITSDQNLQVNSNLTVGNSNLFVDSTTSNVGIGLASPTAHLHVYNNDTSGVQLIIENANQSGRTGLGISNAAGQRFNIQHVGGATATSNAAIIENYSTVNGGIHFYNKGDGDYIFRTTDSNTERMRISNGGKVGIGVESPGAPLEVVSTRNADTWSSGASQLNVLNYNGYGTWYGMSFAVSQTRGNGVIQTFNKNSGGAAYALELQPSGGSVGIGVASPSYQLQLSTNSAAKPSSTTWTVSSDQRIKEDIVDANLDTCYENIKKLKLKYYKLRDDIIELDPMFKDAHKLGWIAQEVEEVLPKCVTTIPEQYGLTEVKNLDSDQIYTNLFGAVQKLMKENEMLKARIEALENSS